MRMRIVCSFTAALAVLSSPSARAVAPTAEEMSRARQWAEARFEGAKDEKAFGPFFSFKYDGKPSSDFLKTWDLKRASRKLDVQRTERTLSFTDRRTGLVLRCVGVEYGDYPCVEWTLFFVNTSDRDTPILSDIQALDLQVERRPAPGASMGEFLLHHNSGSRTVPSDYQPHETVLGPGAEKPVGAIGGRSTGGDFSYFNLEYYGDFWPLTPYSLGNDVWMAWQFDRPEAGEGVVQAFRRAENSVESATFRLRGLDPNGRYVMTDLDVAGTTELTGRELLDKGLPVVIKEKPGAAIITYEKKS